MAEGKREPSMEDRAYDRPAQYPNRLLTEVGPGTPMGELMRRYWQPVAVSADVKDLPRKVRVPGEDLVLFRDGQGPISLHSEEHLVTSDRGITMQRRMLKKNIKLMESGGDPAGTAFSEDEALVRIRSGNFYRDSKAA